MGNFQSVEVGEELTVSSSQSKDCREWDKLLHNNHSHDVQRGYGRVFILQGKEIVAATKTLFSEGVQQSCYLTRQKYRHCDINIYRCSQNAQKGHHRAVIRGGRETGVATEGVEPTEDAREQEREPGVGSGHAVPAGGP